MVNGTTTRNAVRQVSILVCIAAITIASGCVSKGKYNEAIAERDGYKTQQELLELRNTELTVQLESASNDVLIMGDRLEQKRESLEKTERIYGELVDQLGYEVEAGKVQVEIMKSGVNVRISEDILFESGSAKLDADGRKVIERLASELGTIPYQIVVAGYSDNVPIGSELAERYPTNWELAGARSARVVAVLQEAGLHEDQLLAVSFGANDPLGSNDTPAGRAQNRRIEIRIRPVVVGGGTPDVAAPPPWN